MMSDLKLTRWFHFFYAPLSHHPAWDIFCEKSEITFFLFEVTKVTRLLIGIFLLEWCFVFLNLLISPSHKMYWVMALLSLPILGMAFWIRNFAFKKASKGFKRFEKENPEWIDLKVLEKVLPQSTASCNRVRSRL